MKNYYTKITALVLFLLISIIYGLTSLPVSYEETNLISYRSMVEICGDIKNDEDATCCGKMLERFEGEEGTFVIRTQEEYEQLQKQAEKKGCSWGAKPRKIDFTEETLLGYNFYSRVCIGRADPEIKRNFLAKNINFNLEVSRGYCGPNVGGMYNKTHWVLVSKIPPDYTVTFNTSTDLLSPLWYFVEKIEYLIEIFNEKHSI
ncbi:MAG: hypothetical protein ABEJ24_05830 [Candidatus Magasanikbacteria bacterium]